MERGPVANPKRPKRVKAYQPSEQTLLGLRLIDIGYKTLAKELHPDMGGSQDAMARLNRVRERLKAGAH